MKVFATLSVLPRIPTRLARLQELAFNLWWSWEPKAQQLFSKLDAALWDTTNHNPVKLLREIDQTLLDAAAQNVDVVTLYDDVLRAFDEYMEADAQTWFRRNHQAVQERVIAYFSAEFGLHEALPMYSGGLGILSGDHCKEASDLGLPFIGVGFLYPQGYFTQRLDVEGRQQAHYEKIDFAEVPAQPAVDPEGQEILISVELPGRTVYAKIWRIQVGRIPIYLMDTDVDDNAPRDRELSARLYGGDREMRISQEIVLGIGGVRAVEALGYQPAVWHMNEGHSAFLGLERVRKLVQNHQLSFDEAVAAVRADTLFTTHTPVPAGNDAFEFELIDRFFWHYWDQLGIDRQRFIEFARQELPWGAQFSMTVLALRLSAYHNGVSKLHGKISRQMWNFLWPQLPETAVPVGHITNGVHTRTWLAPQLRALYDHYLEPGWVEKLEVPATWQGIAQIPEQELWAIHGELKKELLAFARSRMQMQLERHQESSTAYSTSQTLLDERALTIGFARRFATYKRALLLFQDRERIKRLLNDPQKPVQIIFSGKAHPADEPGKALIQSIYQLSQDPDFHGKVLFLEDYDMNIARHMIAGVDLWLNTPRRPREASGTSGQKAAISGVPNCSILDGWWAEGYDGDNGWAIGVELHSDDTDAQDSSDAESLYTLLEQDIIPTYFRRSERGIPERWVQIMKHSIMTCAHRYSMRRMVIEYVQQYYLPAGESGEMFHKESYSLARKFVAYADRMRGAWNSLRIQAEPIPDTTVEIGSTLKIQAKIWPGNIDASELNVELVSGSLANKNEIGIHRVVPMEWDQATHADGAITYTGELSLLRSGKIAFAIRARPRFTGYTKLSEVGLISWA